MKHLITLLTGMLMLSVSYAQFTYSVSFTAEGGNPGALNTDSDFSTTAWTSILGPSLAANQWGSAVEIPFPFEFYGNPVDSLKASANGLVTFSTTTTTLPNTSENLPSALLPDSTICMLWSSFAASPPTGTNDQVYVKTFGTAPNRQFWVRWHSFEINQISFVYQSVVLEETSNKIYLVDMYSNTPNPSYGGVVGVQLDGTTSVQDGTNNLSPSGNGSGIPDNDYWTFTPELLVNDNAGVESLDNPTNPVTAGMNSVDMTLKNFGLNTLASVDITWEVNGTVQGTIPYATPLAPNATASVNLGMLNFPAGTTVIKVYTSNPNGVADGDPTNDTLEVSLCTGLNGAYTIGGATPDYADFGAAVSDLVDCGVNGPVTFTVAAGTYNEGIYISPFPGSSSTNTVTFDGLDSATTTISYTNANDSAVVWLDGADWITFQNITLRNDGTTDAWCARLSDDADHNTFEAVHFQMNPQTGTFDVTGIQLSDEPGFGSAGFNANYLTVNNCDFTGGDRGVTLYGDFTDFGVGYSITNCNFSGLDGDGIWAQYADSMTISGNTITANSATTFFDGMDITDVQNIRINGNFIISPDRGIELDDVNDATVVTIQSELINNMVIAPVDDAFDFDDVEELNIFHNTVVGTPGMIINDYPNCDIRNNIFTSPTGLAVDFTDAVSTTTGAVVSSNIYNSDGTNLAEEGTTAYTDLLSWVLASPLINDNSQEGDPGFVDPATDLHVVGFLAFDAGDPSVDVLVDIDGDVRPLPPSTGVDVGADEYELQQNDASVRSVDAPVSPLTPGMQNVELSIENFGLLTLDSVLIDVSVNGTPLPQFEYKVPVTPGGVNTNVSVGMFNFPAGTSTIRAWTSMPNGVMDEDTSNDTLEVSVCSGLIGNYTIGAMGDYASFTAAAADLNECGVNGAVTFTVMPGTYNEGIELTEIQGVSALNTVTFDGVDSATTKISYTNGADSAVVFLNGADWITFQNITIENNGTTDAWGARLTDNADHNTFESVHFKMIDQGGIFDVTAIFLSDEPSFTSDGANANYLTVNNCLISGGDIGIDLRGEFGNFAVGNTITNNTIVNVDADGINTTWQDSMVISGNTITSRASATFVYGIDCFDSQNVTITGNNVTQFYFGIDMDDTNDATEATAFSEISNNMFIASNRAARFDDFEEASLFHNTFSGTLAILINDHPRNDVRNNIFYSTADVAVDLTDLLSGTDSITWDYNLYFSATADLIEDGVNFYPDVASWVAANANANNNSVQGDPIFVDPATDGHLLGLAANDVGDNTVGITTDIDGDTRPLAPSTTVDIGADEYAPRNNDAKMLEVYTDVEICGDSMVSVFAVFFNQGILDIDSVDITVEVSGAANALLTATYLDTLGFTGTDTMMIGTFNAFEGGRSDLTAYLDLQDDEATANDTARNFINPIPSIPPAGDSATVCKGDSVSLVSDNPFSAVVWYDSLTGGNVLAEGDTFTTPIINGDVTYYVGFADPVTDSLHTTFLDNNGCGAGNMVDLTAKKPLLITGFSINSATGAGSTDDLTVWYIPNGTWQGNESNQSAWTLLGSTTYTSAGGPTSNISVGASLFIPEGATFAVYVQYNARYTNGDGTNQFYENDDLALSAGVGLCNPFSGVNNPRVGNLSFFYSSVNCNETRTAVPVTSAQEATSAFTFSVTELDVTLTDASLDADSVLYDFGDGNLTSNTAFQFAAPGDYEVCQIAYAECGNDTSCQTLSVTCTAATAGFGITVDSSTFVTMNPAVGGNYIDSVVYDYGDGTISTSPNHFYETGGVYTVCQTVYSPCGNDTSCVETPFMVRTGIEDILGVSRVSVYPNPNKGSFFLDVELDQLKDMNIEITDIRGKVVYRQAYGQTIGTIRQAIELKNSGSGMYFLKVRFDGQSITRKVRIE
ncbi:MAG: right-handed parallel beta-helix repeat-containing protein [Bacteroidota bacterium]